MVRIPSSLAARMTRIAISPRLATSRLRMRVSIYVFFYNDPRTRGILANKPWPTGVYFGAGTALAHLVRAPGEKLYVWHRHPWRRGDLVPRRDILRAGAGLSAGTARRARRGLVAAR